MTSLREIGLGAAALLLATGTPSCAASSGGGGTGGSLCELTCPAGCDLSADCTDCIPESLDAGIGSTCDIDADCCNGSCVAGVCSFVVTGSTSGNTTTGGIASTSSSSSGRSTAASGGATTTGGVQTSVSGTIGGTTGQAVTGAATSSSGSSGSCLAVGASCESGGEACCSQYCSSKACKCNAGGGKYPCVTQNDCCAGATCTAGACQ